MSKPFLHITASATGTTALIEIVGDISSWNKNSSDELRSNCKLLKDAGAQTAHLYINTYGGECFEANEGANILNEFFPGYTGEGGAVVASAGTYMAVTCKTFEQAKNGQFMIHKPSGGIFGNETEVENYLTLLRNMTTTYYDAYVAKLKKPEADFKAKWDNGDFWMTASEAKEWGFVTDVKEPVKIDEPTAQYIKAMGSPHKNNNQNDETQMELKVMALSVGLPENATEQQVNAKIAENKVKADQFDTLKAETERNAKEEKTAKVKAALDKAIAEKRIKADTRKGWETMFDMNFETTSSLLDSTQAVEKLSGHITKPSDGKVGATYQGKTFEQWQDEDPDMLATLEGENPEAFEALFADWKKRNKIQK